MPRRRSRLFKRRLWRRWPRLAVIGGGVIAAAVAVSWIVFKPDADSTTGATVSGVDLGGLNRAEAATALTPVGESLAATRIELVFQDQTITATAEELGIALDIEKTLSAADDEPSALLRPAAWLYELFADRGVDPRVGTDMEKLNSALHPLADPRAPRIKLVDGVFEPVETAEIAVPDMKKLAELLERQVVQNAGGKATVTVPTAGTEPADEVVLKRAKALAAQANELTDGGLHMRLEGTDAEMHFSEEALRGFISVKGGGLEAGLRLDPAIAQTLESLFVGIGEEGVAAEITLDESGAVVISGGAPGFKCCADDAAELVLKAMIDEEALLVLPARTVPHERGREWAESLGLREVVGEFTTRFKPGQDRVTNIARISELTRGAVIEPGARFSVNDFVGPRTRAKGFISAGVINYGVFDEAVGGGISQYATTLFNAAFFAGLDFVEYQSHTIYISRYPYGREATVSHPAPDLVLENNSPYGVMIWSTTTSDSVTVKLYSTPWVTSEQTGQWRRSEGVSCTRVTTQRTRTWLSDGHSETDTVSARYRPEGLKCDGTPTVTTTVPPTTLPATTCSAGCDDQ